VQIDITGRPTGGYFFYFQPAILKACSVTQMGGHPSKDIKDNEVINLEMNDKNEANISI
jgi:hypothetical protein